jgi:peptidoglycan/xylan/chitin deacetylase (PgdA/CDA1 family)
VPGSPLRNDKRVHLTIDDGPSRDWEKKLDWLVANDIPAVWFCEGRALTGHPSFAPRAIAAGHIVANHSYDHPHFSNLSLEQCQDQIRRTDVLIAECYATAHVLRTGKFFRFPYGDKGGLKGDEVLEPYEGEGAHRKASLQSFLREMGYRQPAFLGITYSYYRRAGLLDDVDWHWTYDCMEWAPFEKSPPYGINSLHQVFDRMDQDVPEGGRGLNFSFSEDIVLIHDHVQTTEMFPLILGRLLSKGVRFQPVAMGL